MISNPNERSEPLSSRDPTTKSAVEKDPLKGWLLQRLKAPPASEFEKRIDKGFSFGGGGSGLSDESWEFLHRLFSFDYMGSAEYEFGTVPKTLMALTHDHKQLVAFEYLLPGKRIAKRRWLKKPETGEKPDVVLFVICRAEHADGVKDLILRMAADKHEAKENTQFLYVVNPAQEEWDHNTRGWLDLKDGFFIFVDQEMAKRTATAFGISTWATLTR